MVRRSRTEEYPPLPEGAGLPSNLVNAMLVTRDGTVWAGTAAGLAWSRDGGRTWRYRCGRNHAARVKGVFGGPPAWWREPDAATRERLLPEDFVTCLAESADGTVWAGFREQGCATLDPKTAAVVRWVKPDGKAGAGALRDGYVNRLLALPDGRVLAGGYGGGLAWVGGGSGGRQGAAALPGGHGGRPAEGVAPWPVPAAAPDAAALAGAAGRLRGMAREPLPAGSAVYLGEDWQTKGDWPRRYGNRHVMLCAMNAPISNWTQDSSPYGRYKIDGRIGPHFKGTDDLRHWVHWIRPDNNVNCLFAPTTAHRTQAEWDDHGEAYPRSFDGPDVWMAVDVPFPGPHRLSLYFYNKDGHSGANRIRDYLLEVRQYESDLPEKAVFNNTTARRLGLPMEARSRDLTNAIPREVLARARVRDFWGGVHKTFAVTGPAVFYVRVARGWSHNAIVSGVMVDAVPEAYEPEGEPQEETKVFYAWVVYTPPDARPHEAAAGAGLAGAAGLWAAAGAAFGCRGGAEAFSLARVWAYRVALAQDAPGALLENWRWHLGQWDAAERRRFWDTMMRAWDEQQRKYAHFRSAEFRPYSPNVVPISVEELKRMEQDGIDWRAFIPKKQTGRK